MPSAIVANRLASIVNTLMAAHAGGADVSSASKGRDRELFLNLVLGNVISQPFRVGSGDIVDQSDNTSGQTDIVIEYANTLSFPSIYPHSERLYLAESVCAVVEIKSNVRDQAGGALAKAQKVHALNRNLGSVIQHGKHAPPEKIPLFVVGYRGWSNRQGVASQLATWNDKEVLVSGILQLDPCIYVSDENVFGKHSADGPAGLYGFLVSIEQLTSSMIGSKPPFLGYIK